ncbi:MAG: SMP-30/gluconolactonase/LRE family protein [Acidimicrobiia bacterium]
MDCVLDAGALLGECPVWSDAEQVLYWIDIDGRSIHRFDPAPGADEARALPGRPGSYALMDEPGCLLVALEHRMVRYRWDDDATEEWVEVEAPDTGNRLNDGRCDPAGRFWVGSMYEHTDAGRFTGMLHRIGRDGAVSTWNRSVGVSNGLAFSPDGGTMYFADTLHDVVWAYDYDVDSGERSNERVFVDFQGIRGRPDGACVDADGCYWVAAVYGWGVIRFTPAGVFDRRVDLPVQRPTMPAFGGPDRDVLFVTSIGEGGSHRGAEGQDRPGGIFAVEPGVSGVPEPLFRR